MGEFVPKRKWRYPISAERTYNKWLRAYVKSFYVAYKACEDIVGYNLNQNQIKADTADNWLDELMNMIQGKAINKEQMLSKVMQAGRLVDEYNRGEFDAILKSIGINIFQGELWLADVSSHWIDANMQLISSVQDDMMRNIRAAIRDRVLLTFEQGTTVKSLSSKINAITGVGQTRATLIARDQIGKLNGQLTQYRQSDAGIKKYEWSSSGDSRVRPLHEEYDGEIYSWNNPPAGGHPGIPIRCRCVALPVIDLDNLNYTPRSDRASVAKAMKIWGIPE